MARSSYDYLPLSNEKTMKKAHVKRYLRFLLQAGAVLAFVVVGIVALRGYVQLRSRMATPLDNYQWLNNVSAVAFEPTTAYNYNDHAVVTSLYSDSYAIAVATLGHSLQANNISARMILMYLPDRVSRPTLCLAKAAGWTLHSVPFIAPPHNGKDIHKHFNDQYTKLNLWTLDAIGIKSLIYLDADTLVRKNIDELFTLPYNFAAVPDVFSNYRGFTIGFNAGILFLRPSTAVFEDMLSKLETADYPLTFAEQAFLNLYFGVQVMRLPYAYNANLAIKQRSPKLWEALTDDIRIVHYTIEKPFPSKWLGRHELHEFFDERKKADDGFWVKEMGWWQDSWAEIEGEMIQAWSHCK